MCSKVAAVVLALVAVVAGCDAILRRHTLLCACVLTCFILFDS